MKGQDIVSNLAKELTMNITYHFRADQKTKKVWQYKFTDPYTKKRISKNTPFLYGEKRFAIETAQQHYAEIRLKGNSNHFSNHTLTEAVDEYLSSKPTSRTDKGMCKEFKEEIGHIDIKLIKKDDYKTLVKRYRKDNNADATIDRKFDILRAVLNNAVDNEWIDTFPKIKKYDKDKFEKGHRLSEEEKQKLIKAMQETGHTHLIDPFLFALISGLRKSNIAGMTKSHIQDTIHGKELRFVATEMKWKTKHSIPLTNEMYELLKRNMRDDSEFIFRGYNNAKQLGDFKKSWKSVRAVAGVLNPNIGKHIRWHDLRHTCASDYAERGMNPYDLQRLMHWQSLKMAERYVHTNSMKQRLTLEQFGSNIVPYLSREENACNV